MAGFIAGSSLPLEAERCSGFIASRRGQWDSLLAATVATVAIAAPVLVVCAFVEVYVTPKLLLHFV